MKAFKINRFKYSSNKEIFQILYYLIKIQINSANILEKKILSFSRNRKLSEVNCAT